MHQSGNGPNKFLDWPGGKHLIMCSIEVKINTTASMQPGPDINRKILDCVHTLFFQPNTEMIPTKNYIYLAKIIQGQINTGALRSHCSHKELLYQYKPYQTPQGGTFDAGAVERQSLGEGYIHMQTTMPGQHESV